MKHSTPDSMKFKRLQRRLGMPRYAVAGLLELLWITTQKNAPQGDIGRFDNESIAIECDWDGCPDLLVETLVDTGWLDPCDEYRLVVHDWEDHCPSWVKRQLGRSKQDFVTVKNALHGSEGRVDGSCEQKSAQNDRLEATPNLTKPNQTKPNLTKESARFRRPSLEQIREFARSSDLPDHAAEFADYYESNGWRVARNPMKNWEAAYRNWCKRQADFGKAGGKSTEVIPI